MKKKSNKSSSTCNSNKAPKTLGNVKGRSKESSATGKATSKKPVKIRKIQPAPEVGSISRADAKRAARIVLGKKNKK